MVRRFVGIGFLAAVAAGGSPASGATITIAQARGMNVISISGPSVKGDADAFETIAAKTDPKLKTLVTLAGPGGIVIEGMRIGVSIHRKGWSTQVGDGHVCVSTCAITWLAGQRRIASSDAHIGFHAPFDRSTYKVDEIAVHVFKTYAAILGLADATVAFVIAKSPGQGLDWVDPAQAKAAGLAMDVVPSKLRPAGHFSYAMVDAGDAEAARARAGGDDALVADLKACYAAYVRQRDEAQGFKCFGLEVVSEGLAKSRAKTEKRPQDPRLTLNASIKRMGVALRDTGHSQRTARVVLGRWQRDLVASASLK